MTHRFTNAQKYNILWLFNASPAQHSSQLTQSPTPLALASALVAASSSELRSLFLHPYEKAYQSRVNSELLSIYRFKHEGTPLVAKLFAPNA